MILGVMPLKGNPGSAIDLDNIWAGCWYVRKTDYTVSNWPSTTNGILIVFNPVSSNGTQPASYVVQVVFDGANTTWTRVFTNGWNTWKEL